MVHKNGHKRVRLGLVKTLDEAKALAQTHADKRWRRRMTTRQGGREGHP
jgi:hypothetical protein